VEEHAVWMVVFDLLVVLGNVGKWVLGVLGHSHPWPCGSVISVA
jgi:hypothetical protein